MDRYKKLIDVLQLATPKEVLPLLNAEVKEITGESCTVVVDGLELTEVRLKATINGDSDGLLLIPKVGSMVLLGSLTGDLKDLAVLSIDQMEQLQYKQSGLSVVIDSTDKKVSIENDSTSLKALFQGLADLLKQFKVTTPSGPSTALLPDTMQAVIQFETDFKKLLK